MCFHWQVRAVDKIYAEATNEPLQAVKDRLVLAKSNLEKAKKEAISYHGSLEECYYGFFAGQILFCSLLISALEQIVESKAP